MITVVITTYKREPDMIRRAINSVLAQTYRDIEIIVVDDSPKDYFLREQVEISVLETSRIHSEIDIRYIPLEENMGACVARNTGLNVAMGEYIAYLDDDDEWLPEKLEKQYNVIIASGAALVYCGSFVKNDITGNILEEKTEYYRGVVFKKLLYRNFIGSTSLPLIQTEALKIIGGFDSQMQSAQDYDVWLRIAKKFQVDYVAEPLIIYHEHGGEQISTNPQRKIAGLERLNDKYKTYLDKSPQLWWRRNIVITPYYAANNEVKKAFTMWWKSVKHCPRNIIENLKYFRSILLYKKKE